MTGFIDDSSAANNRDSLLVAGQDDVNRHGGSMFSKRKLGGAMSNSGRSQKHASVGLNYEGVRGSFAFNNPMPINRRITNANARNSRNDSVYDQSDASSFMVRE